MEGEVGEWWIDDGATVSDIYIPAASVSRHTRVYRSLAVLSLHIRGHGSLLSFRHVLNK